jgi:SAM-dependent methyltransferase
MTATAETTTVRTLSAGMTTSDSNRFPRRRRRDRSLYGRDLAYIQHLGFAGFAESAGPGLLGELRRAGIRTGHVVDLGCGDGTWLETLVRHGYAATGIERSRWLASFAAKVPGASVTVASIWTASLPACDAVTAIGEVLGYGAPAEPALGRLFRRAFAALRPGGVLIFDVVVGGRPMAYDVWREGSGWTIVARVNEDRARRELRRDIVTFRRVDGHWRRSRERHLLRVFSRGKLVTALRRAGFAVRTTARYGRAPLAFRRLAFVARKPTIP